MLGKEWHKGVVPDRWMSEVVCCDFLVQAESLVEIR